MENMKILLSVTVIAMLALSVGVAWADEGTVNDTIVDMGTVNDTIVDMGTVNDTIVDMGTVNDTIVDMGTVNDTIVDMGTVNDTIVDMGTVNDTIVDMGTVNDTIVDMGTVGDIVDLGWFRFGPGGDGGRIFAEYGPQLAPILKLSDYDNAPRIQFQQEWTGNESNPRYSAWIGMIRGKSNNLAIIGNNLGIGTTIPRTKLHVAGNRIRLENAGKRLDMRADGSAVDLQTETSDLYIRSTGKGHDVIINPYSNDGKVGIGTTNPRAKLHIINAPQTANGNTLILGPTNKANLRLGYHNDYSWIQSHGSKPLSINPIGNNVGIGTTNPRAKLDVFTEGASGAHIAMGSHALTLKGVNDPVKYGPHLPYIQWRMADNTRAMYLGWGDTKAKYINMRLENGFDLSIDGGNVGIGTTKPGAKLDVNGFTRSLGISVNNGANTGVGRGLWLWTPTDPNHVIYSANPTGKSPAGETAARGYFDAGHRLRLRTATGQGFLFENNQEVALVDIDSDNGRLWTKGSTYSGGTKNFLIDHPLDPEHKELIHSTLEGPEAGVFYRGEAQLSGGEATVMLPDYFEALTRNEGRTVLLTPKFEGDEQISMLAASGVKDGKFRVRMIDSTNPSQKFYWEVKAVRSDVEVLEVERTKTPSQ